MLLENIKIAFRTKDEPKTYFELLPFYIKRIENIIGDIQLFKKKRVQEDKKRCYQYSYNTETIKHIFELHHLKYPNHHGIHQDILSKFSDI